MAKRKTNIIEPTGARERWASVPGHKGRYDVSDRGRVRTWIAPGNGRRTLAEPRIMVPIANAKRGGYLQVGLSRLGCKVQTRPVHTLVLEAFSGPRPSGTLCRHINGNPLDNRVSNLVWGTQSENMADALRHGTATVGSKNGAAKFTDDQVRSIRDELAAGAGTVATARKNNVAPSTISRIKYKVRYASA